MNPKLVFVTTPMWLVLLSVLTMTGCEGYQAYLGGNRKTAQPVDIPPAAKKNSGEPDYITVQHCLIGFRGSVREKSISRSKEEAAKLALELLERAKAGEDFDMLISQNTDDAPPGIYKLANDGAKVDMDVRRPEDRVFMRRELVPAFGNTGFPLEVGQYGLAAYDPVLSPFGWHIVKRIK